MFVVLIEDRHTDVEVHLFTARDRALAYARSRIAQYPPSEYAEEWASPDRASSDDQLLLGVTVNGEGDSVSVRRCPVDASETV